MFKVLPKKVWIPILIAIIVILVGGVLAYQYCWLPIGEAKNNEINLPVGYTLNNYTVEKVLDISCTKDSDCETPGEYAMISRCPMATLCLDKKCTVVCPHYQGSQEEEASNVACTMEAKICPDGSYIGRTGPNCEFAECPLVKTDETADWKTYTNTKYGFQIKYPLDWKVENTIPAVINIEKGKSFLMIASNNNFSGLSLEEWLKTSQGFAGDFPLGAPINGTEKIYVNGIEAYGHVGSQNTEACNACALNPFSIYVANAKKMIFFISASTGQKSDNNILYQMLSTFKFID